MPEDEIRETALENLLGGFDENKETDGETGDEESADVGKVDVDRE